MPYQVSSVRPYIASNSCHCCAVNGADEQLISRSVGTSLAEEPSGLFSSMLITVGMPAENVMPWPRTHSKNRLCENRFATYMLMPMIKNGISVTICGEFQPNER